MSQEWDETHTHTLTYIQKISKKKKTRQENKDKGKKTPEVVCLLDSVSLPDAIDDLFYVFPFPSYVYIFFLSSSRSSSSLRRLILYFLPTELQVFGLIIKDTLRSLKFFLLFSFMSSSWTSLSFQVSFRCCGCVRHVRKRDVVGACR